MTTHRIEITQRHLDNASTDPMGRQAIIDALGDAGMTRAWIKGNKCAMTHADGIRRHYLLTDRVNHWQLNRMHDPGEAQPFTLALDDQAAAGWMEGEPVRSSASSRAVDGIQAEAAGIAIIIVSMVTGIFMLEHGMRPTEILNATALPGITVAAGGALAFIGAMAGLITMRWKALEPKDATTLAICASIIAVGASLTGIASSTIEGIAQDVLAITGMLIAFVTATIGTRCILVHQHRDERQTAAQNDAVLRDPDRTTQPRTGQTHRGNREGETA